MGFFISSKIICCLCRSSKHLCMTCVLSALQAGLALATSSFSFVFTFSFFSLLTFSFSFSCFVFAFSAYPHKGERNQQCHKNSSHHPSLLPFLLPQSSETTKKKTNSYMSCKISLVTSKLHLRVHARTLDFFLASFCFKLLVSCFRLFLACKP